MQIPVCTLCIPSFIRLVCSIKSKLDTVSSNDINNEATKFTNQMIEFSYNALIDVIERHRFESTSITIVIVSLDAIAKLSW